MILQSTTKKLCMLYSIAMVLDVPADELRLCMPDPEQLTPGGHIRGTTVQDMLTIAQKNGFAVTSWPLTEACQYPNGEVILHELDTERVLRNTIGILVGQTASGTQHAVAWDGKQELDPTGAGIVGYQWFYEFIRLC